MGAPVETVEVGGRSFQFSKLPPSDAVPVLWAIMPILPDVQKSIMSVQAKLGKALGSAPEGASPSADAQAAALSAAFDGENVAQLIGGITSKISGKDFFEMMKTMFKSVTLNGAAIDVNFTFGDGVSQDMFAVFGNALRVNFASFLGAGGSTSSPAAGAK